MQRYDATVAAMFFGHTHKDEFEISYSDYTSQSAETATQMSYIAPALTPTSGNPTFRVYSVDPITFGILDYTVYITNISSPTYQDGPTWKKYYSAKETYGTHLDPPVTDSATEMTPAFWHNVTALFESDDGVFQDYYLRKSRGYDTTTCTDDCKIDEICQLRAAESQYNCATITPGVNFKRKREIESADVHTDDCAGSITASIFYNFASDVAAFQTSLEKVLGPSFMDSTVNNTVT